MKILVVGQHFYPEQFRINDIAFELVKMGHDVTVLTGLPNYPKGKVLKEYKWFKNRKQTINGVKIIRCSLVGRGTSTIKMAINYLWYAFFGSLKALFMKKDYDIIYIYQTSPITMVYPARVVKRLRKIPLVIHCLDQWPISITTGGVKKESFIYKILYKISKKCYEKTDLITISSKSFKTYFESELKISYKDKGLNYWPSYAEDDYKNTKSINNKVFDLVFAGNIGPAQSVETIIEAANVLKKEKDIMFHIVGDGLSRAACENLAKQYKLTNVIFHGLFDVSKMSPFYDLADAFLITMVDNEVVNSTLPAKIQSYMVAGKPIIGAISGEVKDVIEEAKCGLCVKSLDYKGLADCILQAKKEKSKLKIWGAAAYKYYQDNFEKSKLMKELEKTMLNTIDKYKRKKR